MKPTNAAPAPRTWNNRDAIGVLTLKGVRTLTPPQRRKLADWLRRRADDIETEPHEFVARFRSRHFK
jgi:hypothetical protein